MKSEILKLIGIIEEQQALIKELVQERESPLNSMILESLDRVIGKTKGIKDKFDVREIDPEPIKTAIFLLDSMVESREQHTDQSRAAIKEALAVLVK